MIKNKKVFLGLLVLLTIAALWAGVTTGAMQVQWSHIWNGHNTEAQVFWDLRVTRVLAVWCVGALLAVSGSMMQRVLNNPLADPYLLGNASGASLGAVLGRMMAGASSVWFQSLGAFLGAVGSTFLLVFLSMSMKTHAKQQLILLGVALSSLLMALLSVLLFLFSKEESLNALIFWSFGSFEQVSWSGVYLLLIAVIMVLLVFPYWNKKMMLMLLGDARARQLGINPIQVRLGVLVFTSLLVACCVAMVGPIGFVGLMIPHVTFRLLGLVHHHHVFEMLLGGLLLLITDWLSRVCFYPVSFPPGIIMALLGVPFFMILLMKKKPKIH
jgi:iron complex transport system permease protein